MDVLTLCQGMGLPNHKMAILVGHLKQLLLQGCDLANVAPSPRILCTNLIYFCFSKERGTGRHSVK